MPTCGDIITRALVKLKVYSSGETPSAADSADGLSELQGLYEEWAAGGMFGRLSDVLVNSDYTAAQGERVRVTNGAVVSVPTDFLDTDGGDFPPYDMGLIEVVDVNAQTVTRWLYDAGQTLWVNINGLTLTTAAPLASKGRGGLAACLALALADEYGAPEGGALARQAAAFKMALGLKLGGDAPRTAPDYY